MCYLVVDIHCKCERCPAPHYLDGCVRAMTPSPRSECVPTSSGVMPFSLRFSFSTIALTMLRVVLVLLRKRLLLHHRSHICMSESLSPPFVRMWCTQHASALVGDVSTPVSSWWKVVPMCTFFWLVIFIVTECACRSISSGEWRGISFPCTSLKPIFPTVNWTVLVARRYITYTRRTVHGNRILIWEKSMKQQPVYGYCFLMNELCLYYPMHALSLSRKDLLIQFWQKFTKVNIEILLIP